MNQDIQINTVPSKYTMPGTSSSKCRAGPFQLQWQYKMPWTSQTLLETHLFFSLTSTKEWVHLCLPNPLFTKIKFSLVVMDVYWKFTTDIYIDIIKMWIWLTIFYMTHNLSCLSSTFFIIHLEIHKNSSFK